MSEASYRRSPVEQWKTDAANSLADRLDHEISRSLGDGTRAMEMRSRLRTHGPALFDAYHRLYGWKWDFAFHLEQFVSTCIDAASQRRKWLRERDRTNPDWMFDESTVWAMAYVDRFAGTFDGLIDTIGHLESLGVTHLHLMPPYAVPQPRNDGGYAVESYERMRPDLGTAKQLRRAIDALADHGISTVLDFVANHTADTHRWAEAAKHGSEHYQAFYFMFPDRTEPDRYAATLRAIFPDRGGDAFTWRDDVETEAGGAWVWTTFFPFQWDLDYSNPDVMAAMAGELLHVANLGPAVVRADATPFLWKQIGTQSENLEEAHTVIRVLALALDLAAPSTRLLSEAIVHPDDVVRYVRPEEADLGYNPLVMSSAWEALATRDVSLLELGISNRLALPAGCQWVTYLRCHDDIGWGFADEDAATLGIDPFEYRSFLNDFYSGGFPGSFARGLKFQENPRTGDARMSGTLASLAGLEQALESADPDLVDRAVDRILMLHAFILTVIGIPLVYLGDELGQLNDDGYLDDPTLAHDNRWAHRPFYPWETLAHAEDGTGAPGRLLHGLRHLVHTRRGIEALGGESHPEIVETPDRSVIAFTRVVEGQEMLGVFNFSENGARHGLDTTGWREVAGAGLSDDGLAPYGYGWLIRSTRS